MLFIHKEYGLGTTDNRPLVKMDKKYGISEHIE